MTLTMRPTGLGFGIDKDRPDYTAVTGEWEVGHIYETRGGPDSLRWFWSMTVNGSRGDLEETKAQFQGFPGTTGSGARGVRPPSRALSTIGTMYQRQARRESTASARMVPSVNDAAAVEVAT